ncbi:hypothetical protein B296_00038451 [Ensete ventricosum]|uniref:F-box domain-containing protein n=1 Tax=Ensete ventricosum TaxID=4639 RepID=A0A426YMZ5_ENSVE|nr:hypothetical protein B296_00038451 [Ensete ventricosum]
MGAKQAKVTSKEREDCESADWSSLEPGLLELIAEQLVADTANHVRFGAVCKAWYVAAGANQRRRSHPRVGSLSSLSARGRARSRFQRLMDTAAVEQLPDKKENSFAVGCLARSYGVRQLRSRHQRRWRRRRYRERGSFHVTIGKCSINGSFSSPSTLGWRIESESSSTWGRVFGRRKWLTQPREVCRWKWKLIDLTSSRSLCWRRVQLNRGEDPKPYEPLMVLTSLCLPSARGTRTTLLEIQGLITFINK